MKYLSKTAIAVLVSAGSMNVSNAALTGADLAAANSYFNSHPDIVKYAPWVRDNVLRSNTLKDANYTLVSNSYYDPVQNKLIYINQIGGITPSVPMSTLTPSKPAVVVTPPKQGNTTPPFAYNVPPKQQTPVAPTPNAVPPHQQLTPVPVIPAVQQLTPPMPTPNAVPPRQQLTPVPVIPAVQQLTPPMPTPNAVPPRQQLSPVPVIPAVQQLTPPMPTPNTVPPRQQLTPVPVLPHQVGITAPIKPTVTITDVQSTKVDASAFKADQDRQDKVLQTLSDKTTQAYNTGMYAKSLAATNKSAVANVQVRQQAQETTIQNHNNQLANHEQRITELENQNNNFQNLKDDVDNNRKRAAVGVASVAAMSNIPQVTDSQTFAVGAGVGGYDSQGAVAVGVSARITDHIVTKASVGAGSFGGATYGAGVSFGW
ncbi:YadA-like family protein [Enterobacter cloacae]|uniref:YadA C-terminal domain-containing protein n=1 Tax=Enterobacter cloacae TaxID=550 RepID=UPI002887F59E|nr:YadA-like family protein [Enterobacter cloacae]MDT0534627.1 YadA-like family protein [Enterobacter cloacae]